MIRLGAVAVVLIFLGAPALGHGGGLNAEGCHNDRKNGGYHCHRSSAPVVSRPAQLYSGGSGGGGGDDVSYPNCTAVRAAGAAPIRRGDPGYNGRLDRDGDGVACE